MTNYPQTRTLANYLLSLQDGLPTKLLGQNNTLLDVAGLPGVAGVVGPDGATAGNVAVFADSTGGVIEDGGIRLSSVVAGSNITIDDTDPENPTISAGSSSGDVVGPASATSGNFASFDGTTGKLIEDSGSTAATFATAAQGSLADSAVQPAAIADMLVDDDIGVTVQGYDAATAFTDTAQAWSAGQYGSLVPLTIDGSNEVAWDLNAGNNFIIDDVDVAFTLNLPTGNATRIGQSGVIVIIQDGTGGYDWSVAAGIEPLNTDTLASLAQAANAITIVPYMVVASGQIAVNPLGFGVAL